MICNGQATNISSCDQVAGLLCFGCEMKFSNRKLLEEHSCTAVSYICSCGMEFSLYLEMQKHRSEHLAGFFTLDHASIAQRRTEKQEEQKEKLKKHDLTQVGDVTEEDPISDSTPQNNPTGTTTNLWYQFQPVVRLETLRRFNKTMAFQCGTCDQAFGTRDLLVEHYCGYHTREGVYGCLRCGLLLLSNVSLPDQHQCGSSFMTPENRFTLGKVLYKKDLHEKKFYRCPHCPIAWEKELQLKKHLLTAKHSNLVQEAFGKETLRCGLCQVLYKSKTMLELHLCPKKTVLGSTQAKLLTAPKHYNGYRQISKGAVPYSSTESTSEFTLKFQPYKNYRMYRRKDKEPQSRDDLKQLTTPPAVHQGSIKEEVESDDDDCYVIESSSTKSDQLFYRVNLCSSSGSDLNKTTEASLFC